MLEEAEETSQAKKLLPGHAGLTKAGEEKRLDESGQASGGGFQREEQEEEEREEVERQGEGMYQRIRSLVVCMRLCIDVRRM